MSKTAPTWQQFFGDRKGKELSQLYPTADELIYFKTDKTGMPELHIDGQFIIKMGDFHDFAYHIFHRITRLNPRFGAGCTTGGQQIERIIPFLQWIDKKNESCHLRELDAFCDRMYYEFTQENNRAIKESSENRDKQKRMEIAATAAIGGTLVGSLGGYFIGKASNDSNLAPTNPETNTITQPGARTNTPPEGIYTHTGAFEDLKGTNKDWTGRTSATGTDTHTPNR